MDVFIIIGALHPNTGMLDVEVCRVTLFDWVRIATVFFFQLLSSPSNCKIAPCVVCPVPLYFFNEDLNCFVFAILGSVRAITG